MLSDRMRKRRQGQETGLPHAVAQLVRQHPGVDAALVERLVFHSRDLLTAVAPERDDVDERAAAFAAERVAAVDSASKGDRIDVLFLSSRNDGMSVIAEALVNAAGTRVRARSAGTQAVERVLRSVEDVMREAGVATKDCYPKPLTDEVLAAADIVVTMIVEPPALRDGQRTEVWDFEDPAGLGTAEVRALRDRIRQRVAEFLAEHP